MNKSLSLFMVFLFIFLIVPFQTNKVNGEDTVSGDSPVVNFKVTRFIKNGEIDVNPKHIVLNVGDTINLSIADSSYSSGINFVKSKWNFLNSNNKISSPSTDGQSANFKALKPGFVEAEVEVYGMDDTLSFGKVLIDIQDPNWKVKPYNHIPFSTIDRGFVLLHEFKTDATTSNDLKANIDIKNDGSVYITPYQTESSVLNGENIVIGFQYENDEIKKINAKIGKPLLLISNKQGSFVFQMYAKRKASSETYLSLAYVIDLPKIKTYTSDSEENTILIDSKNFTTKAQPFFGEVANLSTQYFFGNKTP